MKIKKEKLLMALAAVRPGLAKRDIIEQADHFIFTGKEVVTYNDYICISYPLVTDFKGTVDADKLYKILQGIGSDTIDIEVKENQFRISSKKTNSGLASFKEDKMLQTLQELDLVHKNRKWFKLPDGFIKGVFLCMFSTSRNLATGVLTCVYVNGENIISSDDLRISWYKMEAKVKESLLLPFMAAMELVKFPVQEYNFSEVGKVRSWIHFRTKDNVVFSTRTMAGKYPAVEEHFAVEGKKILLPKEFQSRVKHASILSDGLIDIDKKVKLEITKGKITCTGSNEVGWISKTAEIEYEGKEYTFNINPIFLYQVLDKSTKMIVGNKVAKFVAGKFQHVMVLPE